MKRKLTWLKESCVLAYALLIIRDTKSAPYVRSRLCMADLQLESAYHRVVLSRWRNNSSEQVSISTCTLLPTGNFLVIRPIPVENLNHIRGRTAKMHDGRQRGVMNRLSYCLGYR